MKKTVQDRVTEKIIAMIEAGASGDDWHRPWHTRGLSSMPINATTKKRYRGVNVLMLWGGYMSNRYQSMEFATYKQWQAAGAQVRKGEHGHMVIYARYVDKSETMIDPDTGETLVNLNGYSFLKAYSVFNADQVDGYDLPVAERPCEAERIAAAEQYVAATRAAIDYGGDVACYMRAPDRIKMPDFENFRATDGASATDNAYGTLLHELTHWTGHESRCDRTFGKRFGDHAYALEELCAELGAAFLCAGLGITPQPRPDHARYVANWLAACKADSQAIVSAAARASDAVEYLDGLQSASAALAA